MELLQETSQDWLCKGIINKKGIDYDETIAPMSRLEAIRILIVFASYVGFKLFQVDVKSAFLNKYLMEEVYVKKPLGFKNIYIANHILKLDKALYGLKQAPRV